MPEIKNLFTAGRMNKDLDERIVPKNEYRDALNIQLATSDGSNVGAIQNVLGNKPIGAAIPGKTVGSIVDDEKEKIYWFVKNDNASVIAQYDQVSGDTKPVLVDLNGVLNFPPKITGINIFEGLLSWTDGETEPKIINVEEFLDASTSFSSHTRLYGREFEEKDITVIKNKPLNAPSLLLYTTSESEEEKDKLHELEFVRFAYRWKFRNGQLSVYSPFSEPAFIPGNFKYDAKEAFNEGMQNQVSSFALKDFEFDPNEVEAVDILLKKSNDTNVYKVERVKVEDIIENEEVQIASEQAYSVLPSDQLFRQWDAVPLKAKAQEYISGRLVYANYTLGEDTSDIKPEFDISLINRIGSNYRRSIKSNRTYQMGVLFEDKYGRQTPVISNRTGSINIPFNNLENLNSISAFQVQMQDTLPENNFDRFKIYIKESSSEYYNVAALAFFPDPGQESLPEEEQDVWAAFPSSEINKFKEGDFLYLKKRSNDNIPYAAYASSAGFDASKAKFRVTHVQSDAPNFVNEVPATQPTGSSFPYGEYETEGKFFVKIADVDGMLKDMYGIVPNPTVGYTVTATQDMNPWEQPSTGWEFIGSRSDCEQNPFGQWTRITTEYYFDATDGTGKIKIRQLPAVVDQYCQSYTGFPAPVGELITSPVTTSCGETLQPNDQWRGPLITDASPYLPSRTLYIKWASGAQGWPYEVYVCPSEAETEIDTPAIFETEAVTNILDVYYETEESYPIAEYNDVKSLRWFNCYNFQNGVESDRIRDDYNATRLDKQVRVSTVLEEEFNQVQNKSGLIWSGIFNSRNSVDRLNQFSTANAITKDLNPEYGEIQKLKARDTDLIAFCYDKILRILANKDALFNADGSTNVTASNNVLGQAVPYAGEYGISNNPESFAEFGYRIYFTDRTRGSVLRLSRDGITVISDKGMSDFFRDQFNNYNGDIVGAYDIDSGCYNLSMGSQTVSYSEGVDGWTTRLTFVADNGCYLNNKYYTFKDGSIWEHHSETSPRNTFYNIFHKSKVSFIFNDEPSAVKNFKTLSYEGTQTKTSTEDGWSVEYIETDLQNGSVDTFVNKEGKWFNYIKGEIKNESTLNTKDFSIQGIGVLGGLAPITTLPPSTTSTTSTTTTSTTTCVQAGLLLTKECRNVNGVINMWGVFTDGSCGVYEAIIPEEKILCAPTTTTTSSTTSTTSTTTTSSTTTEPPITQPPTTDPPPTCTQGQAISNYCSSDGFRTYVYYNSDCSTYTSTVADSSCDEVSCPAYGTFLREDCEGFTRVNVYADGNCGEYSTTIEMNSADCGYEAPTTPPTTENTTPPPANTYYTLTKCSTGAAGFRSTQTVASDSRFSEGDIAEHVSNNGEYYIVTGTSSNTGLGAIGIEPTSLTECPVTVYWYQFASCASGASNSLYGYSQNPDLEGTTFSIGQCYEYYSTASPNSGSFNFDSSGFNGCSCSPPNTEAPTTQATLPPEERTEVFISTSKVDADTACASFAFTSVWMTGDSPIPENGRRFWTSEFGYEEYNGGDGHFGVAINNDPTGYSVQITSFGYIYNTASCEGGGGGF